MNIYLPHDILKKGFVSQKQCCPRI